LTAASTSLGDAEDTSAKGSPRKGFTAWKTGSRAVRTALGIADEPNEPLVLVLGFPAYYRRFGFQRASAFGIAPPDGIPDDAWMAVTLSSYSPALRGKVIWRPAFSGVT
jgi:predicted N-acetyltransferase YhbS